MGKLDIQKIVSEELSELTEKEKRKILLKMIKNH